MTSPGQNGIRVASYGHISDRCDWLEVGDPVTEYRSTWDWSEQKLPPTMLKIEISFLPFLEIRIPAVLNTLCPLLLFLRHIVWSERAIVSLYCYKKKKIDSFVDLF